MSPLSSGLRAVADVLDAHPRIVAADRHGGHFVHVQLWVPAADLAALAAELGVPVRGPARISPDVNGGWSFPTVVVSRGGFELRISCDTAEWLGVFPPAVTA